MWGLLALLLAAQRLAAAHEHGRATTAGAELFLLASNFLLYTALVIVAIMICKLYLEAEPNASPRSRARQYSSHDVLELFAGSRPSGRGAGAGGLAGIKGSILDFNNLDAVLGDSPYAAGLRTKADVLRTLSFCSAGLITSFLIWGILQERMLTMPYR